MLFLFPVALIRVTRWITGWREVFFSLACTACESPSHQHVGMFIASLKRNLKWCYAPCREALAQIQIQRPLENTNGRRPGLFIISKTCVVEAERGQTVLGTDPQCLFYILLGQLVGWSLTASWQRWNKYLKTWRKIDNNNLISLQYKLKSWIQNQNWKVHLLKCCT